jgi:hypothetical protein
VPACDEIANVQVQCAGWEEGWLPNMTTGHVFVREPVNQVPCLQYVGCEVKSRYLLKEIRCRHDERSQNLSNEQETRKTCLNKCMKCELEM